MKVNTIAQRIFLGLFSIALVLTSVTDIDAQQRRRKVGKGGRSVEIMAGLDEAASFRGQSEEGFKDWVTRNINFPDECIRKGVQGTVLVGFDVNTEGIVENVHIDKGYHPALDIEAKRVVSLSPRWAPAYEGGTRVSTPFVVPVVFEFNRVKNKTALRPGIVQSYKNIPFQFVKEEPKFEDNDFREFVKLFNHYLIYPFDAKRAGVGGKVMLRFTIGGDNQLWGVLARGNNKILEDEVYRVMNFKRMLNGWTSGVENGQKVNTEYLLVVTFDYEKKTARLDFGRNQIGETLVYDPPVFLGDKNHDFRQFVNNNQRYPVVAQETKVEGTVVVDFVINTRGKIDSVQIVNSVHPLLDKEVVRILRMSDASHWQPAKYNNYAVNTHYWYPFVFSLDKLSPLEQVASEMLVSSNYDPPLFNNMAYTHFFDFIDANIIDINPGETTQKTVLISFILNVEGQVLNIKNVGTIGENVEIDEVEEAIRVVSLSEGYWTPARSSTGRPSSVQIIVPVHLYDKSRYE
jgi:TonB family protein